VAFAPDLAAAGAVEIASRAATEAAKEGRFVDINDAQWEAVAAPLGAPDALVGAVSVLRHGWRFGRRDRVLVAQAGRLLGPSISARRTLEDALEQIAELSEQALRDETTGLPNRRSLLRWLDELGKDPALAVLLVDFDGLRAVNNVLGHQAGDTLHSGVVAGVSASRLRQDDLVARLHGSGGDEFVVCCPGLGEDEAMARAVELEQHLVELRMPRALRHLYRGASVEAPCGSRGGADRVPRARGVLATGSGKAVRRARAGLRLGEAPEVAGQAGGVQDRLVLLSRVRAPAEERAGLPTRRTRAVRAA
jgi:diguanylate cyclase (GGDEF)-like protein